MWVVGLSSHAVLTMLVLIFFLRFILFVFMERVSLYCVAYVCHGATVQFSRSEDNLW